MSLPPERETELRDILRRLSDQDFSPDDARRLNELLHGDPEACELYLDHVTLDAQLRHEFGGEQPAVTPRIEASSRVAARGLGYSRILRFAAAILLGASILLLGLLAVRPDIGPFAGKSPDDGAK